MCDVGAGGKINIPALFFKRVIQEVASLTAKMTKKFWVFSNRQKSKPDTVIVLRSSTGIYLPAPSYKYDTSSQQGR